MLEEENQQGPLTRPEAVSFSRLSPEQLQELGGSWSPALGGRFFALARGTERPDPLQPPDYQIFSDISYAERRTSGRPPELWEAQMKAWILNSRNPFLLKLMDIEGKTLTETQINQVFEEIKSFFTPDFCQVRIDVLLDRVKREYSSLADLQKDFSSFSAFCYIFGEHAGTAIAHLIGAELGIKEEEVKKHINEEINNLDENEKALLRAIDQLREESKRLKEGVKEKEDNQLGEVKKSMPKNTGRAVVANRGKEFNPEGQDRIRYEKLANGIEIFSVCDGAGPNGHEVAEFVGKRLGELLAAETDPNVLNEKKLQQICQTIQEEVLNRFQNSGSTADVIIRLPNNKNFAVHVGEGNIGKITQERVVLLFERHEVTSQDPQAERDEKGVWRISGSKTKSFGVPCPLIIDVKELGEPGNYIIMSDGLSDLLPSIGEDIWGNFRQLLQSSPQEAVDYLVRKVNEYSRSRFGNNADDIAAIVVSL